MLSNLLLAGGTVELTVSRLSGSEELNHSDCGYRERYILLKTCQMSSRLFISQNTLRMMVNQALDWVCR